MKKHLFAGTIVTLGITLIFGGASFAGIKLNSSRSNVYETADKSDSSKDKATTKPALKTKATVPVTEDKVPLSGKRQHGIIKVIKEVDKTKPANEPAPGKAKKTGNNKKAAQDDWGAK